jgi:hypothetical protein
VTALHLVNRLLAALLSTAVVAAVVLLVTEVVRWALDEPPWLVPWGGWGEALTGARAGDGAVLAVSGAAVLLGVLLLVFELKPRRPSDLQAQPLLDGVDTVVTRTGLRNAAETAARSVSGVRSASADVRRRRVVVQATSRGRGVSGGLEDAVRAAVERDLAELELAHTPTVCVRIEEDS